MTAIYTWDVFTTLDGFGSYKAHGDWGGYWGKQGPDFLDRRVAQYGEELRLALGANTFRMFQRFLGTLTRDSEAIDPVDTRIKHQPTTLQGLQHHQRCLRRRLQRPSRGGRRDFQRRVGR
jgi:hypothetical protein